MPLCILLLHDWGLWLSAGLSLLLPLRIFPEVVLLFSLVAFSPCVCRGVHARTRAERIVVYAKS